MKHRLGGPPHAVLKMLSKPNGRDAAKGRNALLSWANSKKDPALTQRSLDLMRPAIRMLATALPTTDPELIGGIFANLTDLWETGQQLEKELQKLRKLRLPEDVEALRNSLLWIAAIQLDMASYWIKETKKDFPKLLKALSSLERGSVRRTPKSSRRSSKPRPQ